MRSAASDQTDTDLRKILGAFLFSGEDVDKPAGVLSGGEKTRLALATLVCSGANVLLLDEPTNNLDLGARHRLYDVLEQWHGCLLLVSHDRALLDRMDRIAELDRGEMRFHGGDFTSYEAAVRAAQEVAEKNVRSAEQDLKREKRELQEARERAARRAGNAARNLKNAGLARIVAGGLKRDAQVAAGKANEMHSGRVDDARARLDEAERALRNEKTITVELPATTVRPDARC